MSGFAAEVFVLEREVHQFLSIGLEPIIFDLGGRAHAAAPPPPKFYLPFPEVENYRF
jgi:hypothetical protein